MLWQESLLFNISMYITKNMGKKRHAEWIWFCTRCKNKVKARGKPGRCDRCKGVGTFIFYKAELVKNERR